MATGISAALTLCLALGVGGCSAPRRGDPAAGGPAVLLADWDDLDAAVDVAAERSEMAVVRVTDPAGSGLIRRYELRTVAAEPVLLLATREELPTAGAGEPQTLTLHATVGRFGSPEREARFLGDLRRRLEQLRGVESSPL